MPLYSLYSFHGGCDDLDINITENLANVVNSYSYPLFLRKYDQKIPDPQSAIVNINIKNKCLWNRTFTYMFNSNGEPSHLANILLDDLDNNCKLLIQTNKILEESNDFNWDFYNEPHRAMVCYLFFY